MESWHVITLEQVKNILATKPKKCALNELNDFETMPWYHVLARQFFNILIFVLIIAIILSYFLGDELDALAILTIVLFNGFLGFIQEWKAETAIKNLKKILAPTCRVIRNGHEEKIDVKNIIPGDCILLDPGSVVPADIRLTHTVHLLVDEAALTGESAPVIKNVDSLPEETPITERCNMAFMGTHVLSGHGQGLVVTTGMDTELGHIAKITGLINPTKTRLQQQLAVLGRQFGVLALFISAVAVIIGISTGHDMMEMMMTGVSLAVSAIPEGLPAVVTIALALGVRAMAHKNALIRRLQAAETLGAVSVICTDKTGTLTKNEMKIQKIWLPDDIIEVSGTGYEPKGVFQKNNHIIEANTHPELVALLETGQKCNHASIKKVNNDWKAIGSPDEAALIVAAVKTGLKQQSQDIVINEFPFDATRKRMSVIEDTETQIIVHAKGAPEVILALCSHLLIGYREEELTPEYYKKIEKAYMAFAEEGLRTLALARKSYPKGTHLSMQDAESHLTFLGIVGLFDPPRNEVSNAITKAKEAGIKVILITGDSPITAHAVAKQIGLEVDQTVTSIDIAKMSDNTLGALLKQNTVFARTIPQDKFRMVKLLQAQGFLTAMTGDGVNDAPALKQADIGIAMGIRGTDVAKSVADIVLSDDNFVSIIDAVQEGRRQYANIRKFVLYLTSSNIGEVLAILINIVLGGALILIPIQILWINLVTDSATAVPLSLEQAETNVMKKPPRSANQPILSWSSFFLLGAFGSYIGIMSWALYSLYLSQSYAVANTVAFTAIVIMANIHALNFRNLHRPISEIGWFSNKWLLIGIFMMLVLQVAAVYTPWLQRVLHTEPLALYDWGVITLCSLPLFIVPELYKWLWSK
ncbi:TPA: cation-transporting P-type ATPase [Legionella pneumophila]|nr:cation-transporting P-type ATPase [Legionella pneumophila]HDO7858717.1 cation-transporting P-type ATPase [Legionella pneumophila]